MSQFIDLGLERCIAQAVVARETEYEVNAVLRQALQQHPLVDLATHSRVAPQRVIVRAACDQSMQLNLEAVTQRLQQLGIPYGLANASLDSAATAVERTLFA